MTLKKLLSIFLITLVAAGVLPAQASGGVPAKKIYVERDSNGVQTSLCIKDILYDEAVPAEAVEGYDVYLWDSNMNPLSKPLKALPKQPVLRSTSYYIGGADADAGILYYSFVMQPYIYAYDGDKTVRYAAGGSPMKIIAEGDYVYYANYDNGYFYKLHKATGKRSIAFNKMNLDGALIYKHGKTIYFCGQTDDIPQVYSYNTETGKQQLIYDGGMEGPYDNCSNVIISLSGTNMLVLKDYWELRSGNPKASQVELVDLDTGDIKKVYSSQGTDYSSITTSGTKEYYNNYITKHDMENQAVDGYYLFSLTKKNTKDGKTKTTEHYFKVYVYGNEAMEITKEEYTALKARSVEFANNKWEFSSDGKKIMRVNTETGVKETLFKSNNTCRVIYKDDGMLVVSDGYLKDRYYPTPSWKETEDYAAGALYIMDLEGNNIEEVVSYVSDDGEVSAGGGGTLIGQEDLSAKTCHVCTGTGYVTCLYCHGTGTGRYGQIGVGGGINYRSCTECSGMGQKLCSACRGLGEIK